LIWELIQDVSLLPQKHLALLPKVAKREKMKKETIKFRCTIYEKKLLKVKARKAGISLSEFCRRTAFDDRIIERLTEEQITLYKMLVKYQHNFKLIGNMFRKRNPKLADEVVKLSKEIRTHLFKFKP